MGCSHGLVRFILLSTSGVARANLLGGGGNKTVAYPDVLQLFNGEIYPVGISIQKSLIKMAIYKIYGMKWGQAPPQFTLAGHGLLGPPPEAYDVD